MIFQYFKMDVVVVIVSCLSSSFLYIPPSATINNRMSFMSLYSDLLILYS